VLDPNAAIDRGVRVEPIRCPLFRASWRLRGCFGSGRFARAEEKSQHCAIDGPTPPCGGEGTGAGTALSKVSHQRAEGGTNENWEEDAGHDGGGRLVTMSVTTAATAALSFASADGAETKG